VAQAEQPVLIYDRIESNRRNTRLLLGLFAVVLLPAVAYVTQYVMVIVSLALLSLRPAAVGVLFILAAIIALAIVVLAAYLEYRYASALMLRFAGAHEVGRDQELELWRTVENLCIGAGLPPPRVYVVETSAANAFATGMDPGGASLVVTRGALELLDRRELEAVLAHELSQVGNYDTRLSTVLAAGVGMLRLPFVIVLGFFRFLFRLHWLLGAGALLYFSAPPVLGLSIGLSLIGSNPAFGLMLVFATGLPLYVVLGAPLLGLLIQRVISQRREFLADADAVLLTGGVQSLATALTKLDAAGSRRMKVGGATAQLYVVDPLPQDAPWWDRGFSTHPPIGERIAALAAMGSGVAPSALRAAQEAGTRFRSRQEMIAVAQPSAAGDSVPTGDIAPSEVAFAAEESRRSPIAFRLTGAGTTLYEKPDGASAPLARLPDGALITVSETEGDFLAVITTDDSFGYISRSAPMTEVDIDDPAT
jgi:heat shock protein HtpX